MNDRIRQRALFCLGLCVLGLAGCRSAPTRLYSLSTLPPTHAKVAYAGAPVRVDAVHLPAETDRVEITTQLAAGGLEIHEFDHWAAPLSKLARQTLTADLIARLPPGKVILAPLGKAEGAQGLSVAILRFGADSGGREQFVASWQVDGGRASADRGDIVTLESARAATPGEVVRCFSELLAQLADHIAGRLGASADSSPSARSKLTEPEL
jgi:uncharacterized lipoprotein YmbA